jgi:hypothetical protein
MNTPLFQIWKKLSIGHSIDLLFLVNLAIFFLPRTAEHAAVPNKVSVEKTHLRSPFELSPLNVFLDHILADKASASRVLLNLQQNRFHGQTRGAAFFVLSPLLHQFIGQPPSLGTARLKMLFEG